MERVFTVRVVKVKQRLPLLPVLADPRDLFSKGLNVFIIA